MLPVKKISGDLLQDLSFFKNPTKLLWGPNGTFLYSKGNLYNISIRNNQVVSKKVLSDLSMNGVSSIYYTPKNNTYYIGTLSDWLFIVKISDFHYPDIPDAFGGHSYYAIGKTTYDGLIVKNTLIYKNKPAKFIDLKSDLYRVYVDKNDCIYYQNAYYLYRYGLKTNQETKLIELDENLASILPGGQ